MAGEQVGRWLLLDDGKWVEMPTWAGVKLMNHFRVQILEKNFFYIHDLTFGWPGGLEEIQLFSIRFRYVSP